MLSARHRPSLLRLIAIAALAGTATAQEPDPAREWPGGAPFTQWTRATGDWGGHRTWLEEHGVEVGGGLTVDWVAPWHGGLRRRDSMVSLLDVNVGFDLDQLLGLPQTLAFVDAYQIEGRDPGDDVGDIQGVSNIQSTDVRQVAEAWIETTVGEALRIKFGKIDFNSEFAFTEEGGEFVNSSGAITPTIQAAPTYPNPATAVNVFYAPTETFYVGVGVFDGAGGDGIDTGTLGFGGFFESEESDSYLTVAEVGTAWTGGNSWGSGRLAAGGWYHGARFGRFDGGTDHGTSGGYAILDQRLWREHPAAAEDRQGFGLMVMVGYADADVAEIAVHTEAGVTWTGAISGRDDDVLGALVSHAQLSAASGSPFADDETAVELFYKLQLTPAISVKPDLQYVVHPGGDPTVDDALVGLLRFEVTF